MRFFPPTPPKHDLYGWLCWIALTGTALLFFGSLAIIFWRGVNCECYLKH